MGQMILPQLEQDAHGVEVVGMMFFDDNTLILQKGNAIGERLAQQAQEKNILLMMCDSCAMERGLAEGGTWPENAKAVNTVEGVQVGCFPDLYKALAGNPPDQIITL
jgi:sulfur relay (sulfurtransferase) complex TusBCD TusD component (DsrE family)